jgi:hypothetical protein
MSDGRISPISVDDLPEEPLLWFIDRVGNRQFINTYTLNNVIYNNDYVLNIIPSLIRSVPSELILDADFQFNEEQCECCICIEQKEAENICQFNCGHTFCVICIDTSLKTFRDRNQDVICSLCRAKVKKITFKKQENRDKIQEYL